MKMKKYLFVLIEIILLICLALFTTRKMYDAAFIILIFSPIILMSILILGKLLKSKGKPQYLIFSIIIHTYIGLNLFSIFDSQLYWRGPFRFPKALTNDQGVFELIVILTGVSLLISVLISGAILYSQKKKSNK